jgi:hypothetical protein
MFSIENMLWRSKKNSSHLEIFSMCYGYFHS